MVAKACIFTLIERWRADPDHRDEGPEDLLEWIESGVRLAARALKWEQSNPTRRIKQ